MALAGILLGLGAACIALFYLQPVRIIVDGEEHSLRTFALTGTEALREAGLAPAPEDRLDWPAAGWLPSDGILRLERARPVWLWTEGAQVGFLTPERIPANWLARAGLRLYPGDRVLLGGKPVDPLQPAEGPGPYTLQLQTAVPYEVRIDGKVITLYSNAETLGGALAEAGLLPGPSDYLSLPLNTPLKAGLKTEMRRARALRVRVGKQEVLIHSSALTVGEALQAAGLAPQGLDFSDPLPDQPLPASGSIRLVRVRESVALAQKLLPYKSSYSPSPGLELDQRKVIQAGQYGVILERERVRSEDGAEVARTHEGEWTAAKPRDQVVGIGTTPALHKLDTPSGTIEYYRAVTVYATSYSPCQQGYDHCSLSTASGTLLKKGVVAVLPSWYRLLAGARVYIPGYGIGVIADTGGGIPGADWVDLGYSEEDYQQWNQNVTLYFLAPIPASVPASLP